MKHRLLSRLIPVLLAAGLVEPAPLPAQTSGSPQAGSIVVLPVKDEINKAQHIFLRRALKLAERAGASAVILDMDTPGGDLSATLDIQKALLSVSIPTYAFVNPNAGSAGALICLATNQIWMSPNSAIGGAAPVGLQGQELPPTMKDKVVSFATAKERSIAETRGHNPDIAEAFINKETEVKVGGEVISPKGQLLTLNANKAARWIEGKPVLATGIATSVEDLVAKAKLQGAVVRLQPSGFERIAQIIASMSSLFLLGGIVCAYLEFKIPGATLPGILAVFFFAAFFGGHFLAGLAGFETIALFLLGVTLILVEVVFFPGTILPAILGAAMMLTAIVLAMADRYPHQPFIPSLDQLAMPLINLGIAIVFAAIVIAILMTMLPKTTAYRRLVLDAAVEGGSASPLVDAESVLTGLRVGLAGVTRTPLRPAGKAQFEGTTVDVVSDGDFVPAGAGIRIEQIEGARVVVAPLPAAPAEPRA